MYKFYGGKYPVADLLSPKKRPVKEAIEASIRVNERRYDSLLWVSLSYLLWISTGTVWVENFVQFQILPYLENFAGINSTFHAYNFCVMSHPRKTRN